MSLARLRFLWKRHEHAASGAGQTCPTEPTEPVRHRRHLGITPVNHGLAVVPAPTRDKVGYCDFGGITCQCEVLEDVLRGDVYVGHDNEKPRCVAFDNRQPLANPFGPGGMTSHEDGHIGTKSKPQLRKGISVQARFPQFIECNERRSRVRAATAHATTNGQALVQGYFHATPTPRCLLKRLRSANCQVDLRWNLGDGIDPHDLFCILDPKTKHIAYADELKNCLQQMIAVGSLANDVQKSIEFARGWPSFAGRAANRAWSGICIEHRSQTLDDHSSITNRTKISPLSRRMRRGRSMPSPSP